MDREKFGVKLEFDSNTPGIHVNDNGVFFKLYDIFGDLFEDDNFETDIVNKNNRILLDSFEN